MSFNETNILNNTYTLIVLHFIQENILYYLPLVFIILGIVGFLGNAITFLQPTLRYNSCCIYLLCSSLVDMINLLVNLTVKYVNNVENVVTLITISYVCKLRLFALVFFSQLSMNLLVLSVIDRYACTCSLASSIRYIRQIKIVPWMILLTIILSAIMSLYAPYYHEIIPGFGCTSRNPILNGILYVILHGIFAPTVMLIFVLLTYQNVMKSRRRTGKTTIINVDRSRNPFLRMIFTQVLFTSLILFQWIIFYIYHMIVIYSIQTNEQKTIHYFFWRITNNIYYLINVKSFYLSTLKSRLFRRKFLEVICSWSSNYQFQQNVSKYQRSSSNNI